MADGGQIVLDVFPDAEDSDQTDVFGEFQDEEDLSDIYINLGSPLVPADIIDDFIMDLFGNPFPWDPKALDNLKTVHDEVTGSWSIPFRTRYFNNVAVTVTYGTKRMGALYIIEKTLNMQMAVVTDSIDCASSKSGKKRIVNKEETEMALEKQRLLIREFKRWVWTDKNRKQRLEDIFEKSTDTLSQDILTVRLSCFRECRLM